MKNKPTETKPVPKRRLSITIISEGGVPVDEEKVKRIWSSGGKYEVDLTVIQK